MTSVAVHFLGGPTAILEIGGLRLLTDPTFDPPGEYPSGGNRKLVKTSQPPLAAEAVGQVDAVLLSHDQHADNLDAAGRRVLAAAPRTFTTGAAAGRLGPSATALSPWRYATLARPDGGELRVTAVPAQHGPPGTEELLGEVTGFVLSAADLPRVYISGDNTSLDLVERVAENLGPIDVALIFAGAGRTALFDAYLTLSSRQAARAGGILGARAVVPMHIDGWAHLTQGPDTIEAAFAAEGELERLVLLSPGERRIVG